MQERERHEKLLDLSPRDLEDRSPEELRAELIAGGISEEEAVREINYLRQISRRRVRMPSDAYFAGARQKILEKVTLRPQTIWDRITSLLLPASWRPIPATLVALVIAIAILTPMLYHPSSTVHVEFPSLDKVGRHISMAEVYNEHVVTVDEQLVSPEELREYKEILLMSTAILGSPSSLSRSRSLAGSPN